VITPDKLYALITGQLITFVIGQHKRAELKLLLSSAFIICLGMVLSPGAHAQAVTWTQTDIGGTGASGTYSFSAGTYTIAGAGTGIGGTADSFSYVSTPTTGNIEMTAKVTSQTNTNNYAVAGLMMRDSLNANGAGAVIGVSPANGVNFTYRTVDGGTSTTMLGPSVAAPVWLRLVHSGTSFAGYQSSDGISWTLVGSTQQITMPSSYYVGFAVSSNSYGNLSTAVFNSVAYMANVPQRSANLITWLRADAGVTYSSGQVSLWSDQSGNGNNAGQGTSAIQPTLTTGAVNGLPAISFNGTSQFLQFGSGFANFTSGASIFVVINPATTGTYQTWLEFGNASSNYFGVEGINTAGAAAFYVYNGTSGSSVTATSALTASQYQLTESIYNGSNTGTVYTNGVQKGSSTSLLTAPNASRTSNYLGQFGGGSAYFHGQIAEILVYNTALSASQRAGVESYIYSKYAVGSQPTLNAPAISPNYGVFSASSQPVTITADPGAQIYYTTNGSTPTSSSTLYTGPFNITTSTTIKAIAIEPFFTSSAVVSAYLQIDPTTANVPRTNLLSWLKADNGVVTSGSNVTQWTDMSSVANNATQSNSSNQPTLVTNAVNGLPALSFNGTSDYLQFGSGFANFVPGFSFFMVVKPTATATNYRDYLYFATNNTNTDSAIFEANTGVSGSMNLYSFTGSTSSSIGSSTAITPSQYQLIEGTNNGAGTGILYTNGVQQATGFLYDMSNVTRTNNYIGGRATNFFYQGQIAEILVYNTALTTAQRAAVESYLQARYTISLNAPSFSIPTGIYSTGQTVTITADPGAQIYFTTDGTVPTTSSTLYNGPVTVNSSITLKAIAAVSSVTSSVTSEFIGIDLNSGAIPRTNLAVWLRSDAGVLTSGSNVTQWSDMSGNAMNATQSSSPSQPTLATGAINGLPAITFSGSQNLQFASGFSNFGAGADIFVVTKPTATSTSGDLFYCGNASNSDALFFIQSSSTAASLYVYNSTSASSVTASTGLTVNQYQMLEASQSGGGSPLGTIYTNQTQDAQGSVHALNIVTRTVNNVGSAYTGQIAEVLVYNTALTATQRAGVGSYLLQKYQILAQAPPTPTISVAGGTLSGPTQVAIAAGANSSIYFTTDGTAPTTSSNLYSGPVNVYYSETLKAIAVANGISSSVASATYTLNSTQWPAPAAGGPALQINVQLPTTAVPQ
jgi:Chitobiase/beta-hexosaminidase C-terminal domain/Concanavalin A-like lectin/glucanases superfamily